MVHIYKFYTTLLEKLNVPNHIDIYGKIINEDYEFYKYYFQLNNTEQFGGGEPITIKYNYDKYTFNIHQIDETDRTSFSIYNNDNDDIGDARMLIFIPKKENYVYIETISYYQNCSTPSMPKTKGGTLLLKTTLKFIDDIKLKYNLKYIQLRDTSTFVCRKNAIKTPISNLYMLTRGDTWYGKYGFIPFDPNNKQIDIDNLVNYKTNQKLVKLVKVKYTNLKSFMTKASYKKHLKQYNEKIINEIFEAYNDRSIKDFFKDFISNYDSTCDMFNEIYKDLMDEVGIVDLYGKTFYKPI